MDSEDEMMMYFLMEEEVNVATDEEGQFMILAILVQLERRMRWPFPNVDGQNAGERN
jgi:hypothetical protein